MHACKGGADTASSIGTTQVAALQAPNANLETAYKNEGKGSNKKKTLALGECRCAEVVPGWTHGEIFALKTQI